MVCVSKLPTWKARNFVITIDAKLVQKKSFLKRMAQCLVMTHFVRYVCLQLEVGSSGYKHWQMYVETHKPQQAKRVLLWLSSSNAGKINIDRRLGSRSDARYYCMKDALGKYDENFNWPGHEGRPKGTKYHEFGHWKPDTNSRKKAMAELNDVIDKTESWNTIVRDDKISGTLKGAMNYAKARFNSKPIPKQEGVQLRHWQQALLDELETTPNDRKIIWYVDEDGGKGKTFMSRYLVANHGAVVLGGHSKDMFYAYANQNIVVYDLSRATCSEEGLVYGFDYEAMESIKDGLYFNTKYESGMRYRKEPAHVVVFANGYPIMDKLSLDRWDIRTIPLGTRSVSGAVITPDAVPVPKSMDYINKLCSTREAQEEHNIDKPAYDWYW